MQPLRVHSGKILPLDRANVDTDQIIPKQFLKRTERTGFGEFLFYDWAHTANGERNPEFVMNAAKFKGASILIAGRNFGCGSSREHAAWALLDYGIRVVIASSYSDIFSTNAYKNGIAPIVLPEAQVAELMKRAEAVENYELSVDLERKTIADTHGFTASFEMDEFRRHCLLEGLDDIALTLRYEAEIAAYEKRHAS